MESYQSHEKYFAGNKPEYLTTLSKEELVALASDLGFDFFEPENVRQEEYISELSTVNPIELREAYLRLIAKKAA